jgi:asparagine synthase (glutamine-hydrolysing)
MCGITGIFNLNGAQVGPQVLQKMTDRLAHRGPDGQGIFIKENVGLGHRRLSILDLSEKGAQPMHSANKDWTIVFNGCIYNYKPIFYH